MSRWSYNRCSACTGDKRVVLPDGPLDARVMVIGEGPGRWEDKSGVPFCGRAGDELDETYLRLAGLDRSGVFVTNMVQCRCERAGVDVRPADALLAVCTPNHLIEEVSLVQPEIVILCGATACTLVPGIDLELEHGFPRRGEIYGHECWIVPMYHPAAGLHETRYMTPMLEDWERLGRWLNGKWNPPNNEGKPVYEKVWGETAGLCPRIAIDTESDENRPYSIQWSGASGRGYMLFADDLRGLGKFREWMASDKPEVVMHNAAFDLDMLDRMGIRVDRFRDTMQELFHLGNMPQGLKAAVYRIFGHRMTSYDEVVTPHSKAILEGWLAEALAEDLGVAEPHPIGPDCPTCGKRHRTDQTKRKPHESEAVLRRVLKNIHSDYDPWEQPKMQKGVEKQRLIGRPWLEELERRVGRMPRRSIVHAPLDQQIAYACSDADWTLRLAKWLEGERARIVQQEWRTAA